MALALPLAILTESGGIESIARFTDGNVTPPKTLKTLGISEGQTTPYKISCWVGCEDSKSVTYCRYSSGGACGSSGPVWVCSCLANSPAMVIGDRYDASICYQLIIQTGSICSAMCITCNGSVLSTCFRSSVGSTTGSYVVQNVDYNDVIRMKVCVEAFGASSVGCAYTCLTSLTDQQQASFVVGSPRDQFVVATS